MNPLESFGEFSSKLTTTDLALYAGIGVVLWVLFKDQLSPVQKIIKKIFGSFTDSLPAIVKTETNVSTVVTNKAKEDVFFDLVVSWKQTRDLAVSSGCIKAVEVADQMFPYLSPTVCSKETKNGQDKV